MFFFKWINSWTKSEGPEAPALSCESNLLKWNHNKYWCFIFLLPVSGAGIYWGNAYNRWCLIRVSAQTWLLHAPNSQQCSKCWEPSVGRFSLGNLCIPVFLLHVSGYHHRLDLRRTLVDLRDPETLNLCHRSLNLCHWSWSSWPSWSSWLLWSS